MELERIRPLRMQMATVFASLEAARERYDREASKIVAYERKYLELAAEIERCYEADTATEAHQVPAD